MQLLKSGAALCLALVTLNGCRKDQPPAVELCQLDGFGGADCIAKDGSKLYRAPSELKNFIALSPADEEAFATWCYSVGKR